MSEYENGKKEIVWVEDNGWEVKNGEKSPDKEVVVLCLQQHKKLA